MMYLKWILLLICVAYAVWPLLSKRQRCSDNKGK